MRHATAILAISLILMFERSESLAALPATTAPAAVPARDVDPAVTAFMTRMDVDPQDDILRQKLTERHNTAVELLKLHVDRYRSGAADASSVFETAREVSEAKMVLARNPREREAVARQVVEVTRSVEARLERQVKSGIGLELNFLRAKLARERAEIELLTLQKAAAATTAPTTRPS